ncbi:NAD-dependent epimerase/dehydratase family protein [Pseudomonas sp. Fl5BN2]|uniref:SDR family oxidoreductase n=1 Tax=unclassified Pseudomonas TaxID=196821 RepID=UPI001378CBFF|nr:MULTISPECIES: SDR family oxidoreductase [unclassified Pseudomonas]NBF05518.1 NAD-dependent epimerase/dehydratase family protein [Pseudomonas sp. Fl5BN2]NBF07639.1 NAD-dependent epimerase/dehydratase family protein [Pseudomonas sp. Fl4BN1]
MKVVLVGATGFVGRHLLAALHAAGHQLIATSRYPQSRSLPGVEWLSLDLDRLGLESQPFVLPADTDLLINAAGLLSSDAPSLTLTQDLGTRALFDLAAVRGVPVLQISALGAGAQPDVPFLASKAAADDYLLRLNIPAVVLRPSLVLGAGGASSRWLARLSPWPLIPLLSSKAQIQPLHVDDLCAAVLALLRQWPQESMVLPLVGPERMTMAQLLDHLRAAQGWAPARYFQLPSALLTSVSEVGDRLGWRALNCQTLSMARRDSLASPEVLAAVCGYHAAPLATRLQDWPQAAQSVQLALRPLLLAVMVLIWLGTALVCIGPGYDWGLRIMAEAGVQGVWAVLAVIGGSLCDAVLGIGLLLRRWRRRALQAQLLLMFGYTLIISLILPHFWFDPYAAVAKNLVLMVATLWLLWTEPRR